MTVPPLRHTRQLARVVRVQNTHAFITLDTWCRAQVLVPVPVTVLRRSTGLHDRALQGALLSVEVRLDALLDTDLKPRNWQLVRRAGQADPARPGMPTAAQLLTSLPRGA
ncbi:hypothetical protein [Streptacidiphilus sp. PAMC 29251]